MKLFDLTFGNDLEGTEELFRRGDGEYDAESGALFLPNGGTVSFGTYFNLFSWHEYARYCGIETATLVLRADGEYTLRLFRIDPKNSPVLLQEKDVVGDVEAQFGLSEAKAGGYVYFTLTAKSDCTFRGGYWAADGEERRSVKIGIVICTFRREPFVKANLERIAREIGARPQWKDRLHVFVVDNAQTLPPSEEDFYTVFPNRNLGGSGGFARGMLEVSRRAEFTHILLMDDDIRFDFGILTRTYHLLAALSKEHAQANVGGAMLKLERPCVQHEFGGSFQGLIFRSLNASLDMRREENLLKNQRSVKPNYNAWWYCCMPASFAREYALPMPFFIKSDDVEYGLRTIGELILMSGIAVWHQDFGGKYTGTLEYYIKRNAAVTAAMHGKGGSLKAAIRFAYFIFKGLSLKNYDSVELICRAYLDFKEGPAFFLRTDPALLNDEIRAKAQPFVSVEELEKAFGELRLPQVKSEKRHSLVACFFMFLENYTPSFLFSKKTGVTDAGRPRAGDCFLKKTIVHYDEANGRGFVCRLDPKRRAKLRRAAWRSVFGILFGYRKLCKEYKNAYREICSETQWNRWFFPESPQAQD